MINVFAVFTGKLLQTLQNSTFHKTCYLEAKTNPRRFYWIVLLSVPVKTCFRLMMLAEKAAFLSIPFLRQCLRPHFSKAVLTAIISCA